jgi:hypothetical protein
MHNPILVTEFLKSGGLKPISDAGPDDLFVACGSFEPRSRCLTDCMTGAYRARRSAVYVNREFQQAGVTPTNLEGMRASLAKASEVPDGVRVGSWEDASEQFRVLRNIIAPNGVQGEPLRITLDITTFNREALLACLTIVRWAYPNALIRLAYVSPKEYNPSGRAELQKIAGGSIETIDPAVIQEYVWLSRGFRKMRNAIGFAGFQKPNLPSLLILLPGYEVERPLSLVDNLEPAMVLLGKAIDSTKDEFFERSVQSKDQMLRLFKARQPVLEFEFSCKLVEESNKTLAALVEKYYASHNIFLASMSTKPTLIAAFLLAERFSKIQLTSSVPGEYNVDDYSSGVHEISFFVLPSR